MMNTATDEQNSEKQFTLSVLTENKSGLLNRITGIFSRRKINIEAINVSVSEIEGVSRYTIMIRTVRDKAEKIVQQILKQVETLDARLFEPDEIHYQEIALYKIPLNAFVNENKVEKLVRQNGARILAMEDDYILLEKTGHKHETRALFEQLKPFGVLEFIHSGSVVVSKGNKLPIEIG